MRPADSRHEQELLAERRLGVEKGELVTRPERQRLAHARPRRLGGHALLAQLPLHAHSGERASAHSRAHALGRARCEIDRADGGFDSEAGDSFAEPFHEPDGATALKALVRRRGEPGHAVE